MIIGLDGKKEVVGHIELVVVKVVAAVIVESMTESITNQLILVNCEKLE